MANMSYCRMQNTLSDLQDCYVNWDEDCSEDEANAKAEILALCKKIVKASK